MAERHVSDSWLSPALDRHLERVPAPDELWRRIQNPPPVRHRTYFPAPIGLLAAAALVIMLWMFFPREVESPQALAVQALERGTENLELQSETSEEIRAWVKKRTGLDLPLPPATSQTVKLQGVCAVKGGRPTIEVAYRVGGHNAALLVSKASMPAGEGKHRFLKCESSGGTRVSSWTMRGQLYTLAYASAGNLRDECLLCHAMAMATALN